MTGGRVSTQPIGAMDADYEYIIIRQIPSKNKTFVFDVLNKRYLDRIGSIRWYGPWRQYCFEPAALTVFSMGCMADITAFIVRLMDERRTRKTGK